MIRTLSIVEITTKDGIREYAVSGELPLDEAARALVIIAFSGRQAEQKTGEEITSPDVAPISG